VTKVPTRTNAAVLLAARSGPAALTLGTVAENDVTQGELIKFLLKLEPVPGSMVCVYAYAGGLPEMFDEQVMIAIPRQVAAGKIARLSTEKSFIPSILQCDRILLDCKCALDALRTACPSATTNDICVVLSTYSLWGRVLHTVRVSCKVSDGDFVLVQFESDPEKVYLTREQYGAPSTPAAISVKPSGFEGQWTGKYFGEKLTSFTFMQAGIAEDLVTVSGLPFEQTLVHHYRMPQPGEWGKNTDDLMLYLRENVSNVDNVREGSGWIRFNACARAESPTFHEMYTRLSSFELSAQKAASYSCSVETKILSSTNLINDAAKVVHAQSIKI